MATENYSKGWVGRSPPGQRRGKGRLHGEKERVWFGGSLEVRSPLPGARGAGPGARRQQGPDGEEARVAFPEREEVPSPGVMSRAPASLRFYRICWLPCREGPSGEPREGTKVTAPWDNKHCLLEGSFKIFPL